MEKSKVAISVCKTYDEEKVYEAVKAAADALGGIRCFVNPSEKILVKPNFLYPSTSDKPITTHPSVIKAVIRLLEENDCNNILCGDSPAHGTCKDAFEKLGLDTKYMTSMTEEVCKDGLYFTKEALECDAIIGVSKMKTHMLERITGAVKNMYGLICGFRKAAGHVSYPNAASFAKMLTKIHGSTNQRLHIMDGVIAMEGNGPSSGTPVSMGVILASTDPVALDSVFCHLVNLDPALVPTETYGFKEGIGTYKEDEIELVLIDAISQPNESSQSADAAPTDAPSLTDAAAISFNQLEDRFGKPNFDVQREKDKLNILSLWSHITNAFTTKPFIDESKCVKCGMCVSHCPVEGRAVTFAKGKDHAPVYDYKKCIRCFCCQEICPKHAIGVK